MTLQFSQKARTTGQSKREFAQFRPASHVGFRDSDLQCQMQSSTDGSSKLSVVFCQHRYPSPCRFALTQSRPAYPLGAGIPDLATNRYMWLMQVELTQESVNLNGVNTKQKGNLTCLRNPGSSQRLQQLVLLAASKLTANVRLLARALAALQAKPSAITTVSKARLQAALSAHCPATSLAAKTLYHKLQFERRRGLSPAAFSV